MYPNSQLPQLAHLQIAERVRDADARRIARAAVRTTSTENTEPIPSKHRAWRTWFSRPAFT